MSSYKSVAVWGGTGNLGPAIVNNLIEAGFDVTVLSRSSGSPPHVSDKAKVVQVNVASEHDKLVSTLKGVDAVVSATGNAGMPDQPKLIDASIEAGVKLFFPSEFGSDTRNPLSAALPVFGHKIKVQKYLEQKADEGKIGYVLLANSAFLDWGLEKGFIIDTSGKGPVKIWNGGDVEFSATLLDDIGKAVVGIIKDPKPFWNKQVVINSTVTTQNKLLAAVKKAKPDTKYEVQQLDTEDVRKQSLQTLQSGQGDIGGAMVGFLMSAIFNPAYGSKFDQSDSKKLGLRYLDDAALEAEVKNIIA